MQVLLQPAGNEYSERNFRNTVEKKIHISKFRNLLSDREYQELYRVHPEKNYTVWGISGSKVNSGKWARIQPGDTVLFYNQGIFHTSAIVLYKIWNHDLAMEFWGQDENGETWPHIYFIGHVKSIDIDWNILKSTLGYKPKFLMRGFLILDLDKSQIVLERFLDDDIQRVEDRIGEESTSMTYKEKKQYVEHFQLEGRNQSASKAAKRYHGLSCQACGFTYSDMYGELGEGYIEAHHIEPISELPIDHWVRNDPRRDFAVLCANCHRMIHRKGAPKDVEGLRNLIGK